MQREGPLRNDPFGLLPLLTMAKRMLRAAQSWLAIGAYAAALLGCGKLPVISTQSSSAWRTVPHHAYPSAERSWIDRSVSAHDLLYVSNLRDVTVYSYPQGDLVGKLKGFFEAAGECVDKKQNVWITDIGHGRLVEYAHGGTKPLRVIKGVIGPGCAIDPATGNLAVTTEGTDLYVYKSARGKPTAYTDRDITEFWFCGYDDRGNLFADGSHYEQRKPFELAELRNGGSALETIGVTPHFSGPGGIQWDGKHVTVGDSEKNVYQFSISGRNARTVGMTHLGGKAEYVYQFFIQNHVLAVPNNYFSKYKALSNVLFYNYPTGGGPTKAISKTIFFPHGVVVSLGTSHFASAEGP